MKMCPHHWDKLRTGVQDRGMFHLVHKSGEALVESLKEELNGQKKIENYDPLMDANMMIMGRAIQDGGPYLLGVDERGEDYCPLCEVNKHGEGKVTADDWIKGCLDSILKFCRENNLVAGVQ